MHYLITGGAGFIGSHLADALLEQGHTVHAYDNLSTGRRANVAHLAGHDRFALTVADVLDVRSLGAAVAACDRVVHLAAAVGVKRVMEKPVETILTNVRGTEEVLALARRHGKEVLLASTSEVYGKAMQVGGREALGEESDLTIGPTSKRRWAYACSKALDEFLARAYHDAYGLPVVTVRFFNTVGPRQSGRYGMVVPTFVRQALTNRPIQVHGDGTQTRCFTHVADAVRAVLALLKAPEAVGQIFNVGRPTEISINDLAERVRALTGSSSEIVHVPYDAVYGEGFEDMRRRTPDIRRLQTITDFSPAYDTDDILQDVVRSMSADRASARGPAASPGRAPDREAGTRSASARADGQPN